MRPTHILASERHLSEKKNIIMMLAAMKGIQLETDSEKRQAMLFSLHHFIDIHKIKLNEDLENNNAILEKEYHKAFEKAEVAYQSLQAFPNLSNGDLDTIIYAHVRTIAECLMHLLTASNKYKVDQSLFSEMQQAILENWDLLNRPPAAIIERATYTPFQDLSELKRLTPSDPSNKGEEVIFDDNENLMLLACAAMKGMQHETNPSEREAMLFILYKALGLSRTIQMAGSNSNNLPNAKQWYIDAFREAEIAYNLLQSLTQNEEQIPSDKIIAIYESARIIAERLPHLMAVAFSSEFKNADFTENHEEDQTLIVKMQMCILDPRIWNTLLNKLLSIRTKNHGSLDTSFRPATELKNLDAPEIQRAKLKVLIKKNESILKNLKGLRKNKGEEKKEIILLHNNLLKIILGEALNESSRLSEGNKETIIKQFKYLSETKKALKIIKQPPFLHKANLTKALNIIIREQIPKATKSPSPSQGELLQEIVINYIMAWCSYLCIEEATQEIRENILVIKAFLNQEPARKMLESMKSELPENSLENIFFSSDSTKDNIEAQEKISAYCANQSDKVGDLSTLKASFIFEDNNITVTNPPEKTHRPTKENDLTILNNLQEKALRYVIKIKKIITEARGGEINPEANEILRECFSALHGEEAQHSLIRVIDGLINKVYSGDKSQFILIDNIIRFMQQPAVLEVSETLGFGYNKSFMFPNKNGVATASNEKILKGLRKHGKEDWVLKTRKEYAPEKKSDIANNINMLLARRHRHQRQPNGSTQETNGSMSPGNGSATG